MSNVVRESVEGIGISKLPYALGKPSLFTEISIPELVKIPDEKPDIENLLSIMVDTKILSLKIINTPTGISYEGQKLTGKKLSIELLLKQKIKYIADEPAQSVHAAHFEHIVKSILVIIPDKLGCTSIENLLLKKKLIVTPYIEDIYGELIDKRTIFKNITALIRVTAPCVYEKTLNLIKSADKSYVEVGDILNYTVKITNTDNFTASNVVFKDIPPEGTSYITDSFKINNVLKLGANPINGVNVGDILPGKSITVSFTISVNTLPSSGQITNSATSIFEGLAGTGTATSNIVTTFVKYVSLNLIKSQNKNSVILGDTLIYTTIIQNKGNVTATNVIFKDTPPVGTSFIQDSVNVNGFNKPGEDPSTGINVGTIMPGNFVTVSYEVTVDTMQNPPQLMNISSATYDYILDPDEPIKTKTENSNIIITNIENVNLDMVKTIDKNYLEVGDTATYTVSITNTGTVPVNNVLFTDTPPTGTSFIPHSFGIDGNNMPSADPSVGVNIGNIPVGGNITVHFNISIDSLPTSKQITNTAYSTFEYLINPNEPPKTGSSHSNSLTSQIEIAELSIVKSANKTSVNVGDPLTYEFTITNTGTVTTDNIIFEDTPPSGTTFITDSFKIGSTSQPGADPASGINIGSLSPGTSINVSFDVTVNLLPPSPYELSNTAYATFNYKIDPSGPSKTGNSQSNNFIINVVLLKLTLLKSGPSTTKNGIKFTYTIKITNDGTISVNNMIFTDVIPGIGTNNATADFQPNTFAVDGTVIGGVDPNDGVNIGSLNAGNSLTVTFDVIANATGAGQVDGYLYNQANIQYSYGTPPSSATSYSNTMLTVVQKPGNP